MKIDAVLSPPEIDLLPQRDLRDTTCIIFDVLRATSSILTALTHGAREIYPAGTIEEALSLKERMPDALLGGERHGERVVGPGSAQIEHIPQQSRIDKRHIAAEDQHLLMLAEVKRGINPP